MSRPEQIAERLREVLLNGRWIANTNYHDQLQQVSWQQATLTISGLNSIAALTFHINYYLEGLLRAMETGKLEISDQYSFQLPPIHDEADWQKLTDALFHNARQFADKVAMMDDALLDGPFIDERYGSYLRNIEAVIEHSYYHLGQIALLRKLTDRQL